MNPFKKDFKRALEANQAGRFGGLPMRRGFDAAESAHPSNVALADLPSVVAPRRSGIPGSANDVNQNTINLVITNNNASNVADMILSAGMFNSEFTNRIVLDGTNDRVNLAGQTVSVTATAEYGFRAGLTWAALRERILQDGILFAGVRIKTTTDAQKIRQLNMVRRDTFGDDAPMKLNPDIYSSPNQYHDKDVIIDVAFALTKYDVLSYTVNAGQTVTFTFYYLSEIKTSNLADQALLQLPNAKLLAPVR